jgi:hypothetical protein
VNPVIKTLIRPVPFVACGRRSAGFGKPESFFENLVLNFFSFFAGGEIDRESTSLATNRLSKNVK